MADLPTPIKKQLAEIEELYKSQAPAPGATEGDLVPESETPAPESAVEAPAPQPDPAAQPEAPADPAPAQEDPLWEKRYKTLQGIHRQNVDDYKGRVKERDSVIAELQQQIAELKASKPAPTVDPKDVETFGEDLIAVVQRIVDAKLGHSGAQAESRFADLETRLSGTTNFVAQTAEGLFLQHLASQVPDYEAINVDEGFLQWLAQPDDVYGEPRQAALDRATQVLDAGRVARIFNAYKATLAPVQQPAQQPARTSPQAQLERQVAPRASSSSAPQAPAAKRIYTAAEVGKFYDDVAKGRYASRQDEMKREEAAINAALAEGRIR